MPDHWTGAAPEVEVSPHKLTPRVAALLEDLAGSRQRYTPAALLKLPPLLA
ncbi:hypothetical protein CJ469_06436 [Nocardia farcinica]|nr:hypothetical protein CJ469_06436 [Nocardia farcinica]